MWLLPLLALKTANAQGIQHPMLEFGEAPRYSGEAPRRGRLVGQSKLALAQAMHGGQYHRAGGPKAKAACHRLPLSDMGEKLLAQSDAVWNRSVLILVQTMTKSTSNLCEGARSDWRDAMAQCMHQITGLRVVAHNDDGTCADCGSGGEDKRMKFLCTNHYCGNSGPEPFWIDAGQNAPFDYLGACDVYAFNRQNDRILNRRHVDPFADPPTRVAWVPLLNPHGEIRGIYERSLLYASVHELPHANLPDVRRSRVVARTPDFDYQRNVIEPAFRRAGIHTPIEVIRDDALPKPVLLPLHELELRDATLARAREPRDRVLLYIGSYRPSKGQLDFLRKLDRRVLGPFRIEFYGLRQPDLGDDWDAIVVEAESPRLKGRVTLHGERVNHETMMVAMSTASGLIHFSSGDRNPRVLYEALVFGLPVFASIQSMPYIGLQCQAFATLTDTNATAAKMNSDLRHFVKYLTDSERAKSIAGDSNMTEVTLGGGDRHWTRKIQNAQLAIRDFVDEELEEHAVYANLAERFGFVAPQGLVRDAKTPWVRHGRCRRALKRFENWRYAPWGPAPTVKHSLNIKRDVDTHNNSCELDKGQTCKLACYERNRREFDAIAPRQWWQSRFSGSGQGEDAPDASLREWKAKRRQRLGRAGQRAGQMKPAAPVKEERQAVAPSLVDAVDAQRGAPEFMEKQARARAREARLEQEARPAVKRRPRWGEARKVVVGTRAPALPPKPPPPEEPAIEGAWVF